MEVSIIVPIYNVEKYLPTCLDSILHQTFKDFECLLVIDGSRDHSLEICESYAKKDSRFKVVLKENGGVSSARNKGVEVAQGKYIGFVDPDDYVDERIFELLYTNIKKYDADMSTCGTYNVYQTYTSLLCQEIKCYCCDSVEAYRKLLIGQEISGAVWGKLIKKELFGQHPFPLGKIYEDAFFYIDLMQKVEKVVVDTTPLYYYIHRIGSLTAAYKPSSYHAIEAYTKNLEVAKNVFPSLLLESEFKLLWAHFDVLDRMLREKHYSNIEHYQEIKTFLKKNVLKVIKNPYFTKNRKISAIALKVNIHLYRFLSFLQSKKNSLKS